MPSGVVGVDHADQQDAQLLGFGDGDLVVADVDDEDGVRQSAHVLDAADVLLEPRSRGEGSCSFWTCSRPASFWACMSLRLIEVLTVLKLVQHAAEPALLDDSTPARAALGDRGRARCAGADHQDGAAVGGQLAHWNLAASSNIRRSFSRLTMWILFAVAEDERAILGVPETGLVTEVDAGFQHFRAWKCSWYCLS